MRCDNKVGEAMPILEARAVTRVYHAPSQAEVFALHGVDLALEQGSFTVVVGPSGSGKTTLLALLGLLERPTSGSILFDGKELSRCSDVELARLRRRMGFIFQDFALIPNLTSVENVTYPLIPRGVPRKVRIRGAQELLARFGMRTRLDSRARELSGGEQQRVAISRALAGNPDVIFADEPTSNLDLECAEIVWKALRDLQRKKKTLVVASHDQRVIDEASVVCRLDRGKIVSSDG
jgi:ABC-type lipoprotein export system ATPase subunit